jgi:hypothetical protein
MKMKRFHALEWEDLQWFPSSWRDYGTDFLQFLATKFDIYKPILPILKKGLDASKSQEWVDCASGGGGGLENLAKHLKPDYPNLKITLTDFYPNVKTFERFVKKDKNTFSFEEKPVDATDVPPHLQGKFRTMFGSFHHFRPADAQKILQNAVNSNTPIAIFEPVGRNAMSWVAMAFVILNVLFFTPFIRPVRWTVLPFIYLVPLVPLYILWDGIASILRTYSDEELREMIKKLKNNDRFEWELGSQKTGPSAVNYLIGIPKKE